MTPLHRHQLARLSPCGWQRLRDRTWDPCAAACLAHWSFHDLPLVVTHQRPQAESADGIALGLPAPGRWERRRLALVVPHREVASFHEFPRAEQIGTLLPSTVRPHWLRLCVALAATHAVACVHGSYGWQRLTALDHLRSGSDIDLAVHVAHAEHADEVAATLQTFPPAAPRLDGELVFPDGAAVAWREWLAWRAGRRRAVLVKRLDGCSLWRHAGPRRDPVDVDALAA